MSGSLHSRPYIVCRCPTHATIKYAGIVLGWLHAQGCMDDMIPSHQSSSWDKKRQNFFSKEKSFLPG
jgi:hypothetical protein